MARLVGKLRDVGFSVNLTCSVLKVPLPLLRRSYLSAFGARVDRETLLKEIGEFYPSSCSADGDPRVVIRPRTPPRRPARGPLVARDRSSRQLLPPQARSPREPASHCDFVKLRSSQASENASGCPTSTNIPPCTAECSAARCSTYPVGASSAGNRRPHQLRACGRRFADGHPATPIGLRRHRSRRLRSALHQLGLRISPAWGRPLRVRRPFRKPGQIQFTEVPATTCKPALVTMGAFRGEQSRDPWIRHRISVLRRS